MNATLELRRTAGRIIRVCGDAVAGRLGRSVPPRTPRFVDGDAPPRITIRQPLGASPEDDAKRHNILLASTRLNGLVIEPGRIFSFWRIVGRPSRRRGFRPGRSLLAGELTLDSGGGLCQLAGILYHLSLVGGLEVIERHHHSRDVHTDATRYTPLGADASVAFGIKDLRIANPHPVPISFRVALGNAELGNAELGDAELGDAELGDAELGDAELTGELCAPGPVPASTIEFIRNVGDDGTELVETWRRGHDDRDHLVTTSIYRTLDAR